MKRLLLMGLVLVMMLSVVLTGCTPAEEAPATDTPATETPAEEAKDVKVGFIYVGPIGDGGWTFAHNEGRLFLEQELGVETMYVESVPETTQVEQEINNLIDQGANVIFATSFGYMDHVKKLSQEHPDVVFLHCSGYESTENMNNYFGKIYEPRFLSGLVAGMKTEANKIGYVAAFEIPEVIRGINAFALGVQAVNPDAVVDVRWTHTWYDPAKEKDAAISLLDDGCDVIAQHQDTAGPIQAAEERGAYAVGYNTELPDGIAPNAYMTAPVWNWGVYYKAEVEKVMNGTWTAENSWGGMDTDIVKLAPLTSVAPEGAQAIVDEYTEKILSGDFDIFAEIETQDGEVKTGLTDGDLLGMNYFVKNVIGKIEQ